MWEKRRKNCLPFSRGTSIFICHKYTNLSVSTPSRFRLGVRRPRDDLARRLPAAERHAPLRLRRPLRVRRRPPARGVSWVWIDSLGCVIPQQDALEVIHATYIIISRPIAGMPS